jgi:hypothetical protein
LLAAAIGLFALIACGGGPAATPGRSNPVTVTPAPSAIASTGTGNGGEPTAEALCEAVSGQLAAAALGQPADPPQSGDVVPRPAGVYCNYAATDDPNTNVEAQLKLMSRDQFEALAETIGAETALPGVGEAAFSRDTSSMGGGGATVVAWDNGRGVTVILNRADGTATEKLAATAAIAAAALASP